MLDAARAAGMLVDPHARRAPARPRDAPPAKVNRGAPSLRIGAPGPMGRILVRGEPGHDIIPELAPIAGETVIDKPGKGAFYATDLELILRNRGIERCWSAASRPRCACTRRCARPTTAASRCIVLADCCASYFPEFHAAGLRMIAAQGGIFGWVSSSRRCWRRSPRWTRRRKTPGEARTVMTIPAMKPQVLWTPGDWNAFFGFGTNILVNMLVLTGLLRFVLKMPDELVFGRILPALGLMMCLSPRCTTPGSPMAPGAEDRPRPTSARCPRASACRTCSSSCFVIMLPISLKTERSGQGLGGRARLGVHPELHPDDRRLHRAVSIRRITPRAALLGTLAGVSIAFISMRPALEMFMTPVIGLVCFAIILVAWFGGVRYRARASRPGWSRSRSAWLIAWGSTLFGFDVGGMSLEKLWARR
jgi:nicotinamidase-related amidase